MACLTVLIISTKLHHNIAILILALFPHPKTQNSLYHEMKELGEICKKLVVDEYSPLAAKHYKNKHYADSFKCAEIVCLVTANTQSKELSEIEAIRSRSMKELEHYYSQMLASL